MQQPVLCAFLAIPILGCGGSDAADSGPDAAVMMPMPDAAAIDPSIAPLVGDWHRNAAVTVGPDALTFHADGSGTAQETGKAPEPFTYRVPAPQRLAMTEDGHVNEGDMFVSSEHLVTGAYFPQGTVTGVVGTWRYTAIIDTAVATSVIVVNADHSGTYSLTGPGGTINDPGTWTATASGIVFDGATFKNMTLHAVGEQALGTLVFDKGAQ